MNTLSFISEQAKLREYQERLKKLDKLIRRYWRHLPTGLRLELQKLEGKK